MTNLLLFIGGGLGPSYLTTIVEEGDKETMVGNTRVVPGGITEEILATIPNQEITYSVIRGPFPCKHHLGNVLFEEIAKDKTKITWTVQYVPYFGSKLIVKGLVHSTFNFFLSTLSKEMTIEDNKE